MHDYFYKEQSNQFVFYRIPKLLFEKEEFKNLSTDAKVLYGVLLDRMALSEKNGWIDEHGRVFIYYRIEDVMEKLGCAEQKAVKLLTELEQKAGLIEKKRQGFGRPNLIYVKNFATIQRDRNPEKQNPDKENCDNHSLNCENHNSSIVKITTHELRKSQPNNTENNEIENSNTEFSDIYPFIQGEETISAGAREDGMMPKGEISRKYYESYFKAAINYDALLCDYPDDKELLQGIMEVLVDSCCTTKEKLRVSGEEKSAEVVKHQFMRLNMEHIRYVLLKISKTKTPITNLKAFLMTILYTAPASMKTYYRTMVNRDYR